MRQFNEDTLTDAVVARLKKADDPRFRQIMTSAVKHLHAFAREVQLTEEEWFEGIKFLTAVGQKCDDKRQEFILLSDILGLSMMIVALNHKTVPGATEATVLGPFFAHGAKEYEYGADLREGASMKGEDVYVSGRVLSLDGKPVANAVLDIWQAKADGIYDVQTEGEFELRGRVKADAKGDYAFTSYKPKFYSVADRRPGRGAHSRDRQSSHAARPHARHRLRAGLPAGDHARLRRGRSLPRRRRGVRGEGLVDRQVPQGGRPGRSEAPRPAQPVPAARLGLPPRSGRRGQGAQGDRA
jgi:hydroxyquinol 1,2-dioxygenase